MKKLFTFFLFIIITSAAIAQCGNSSVFVTGSLTPPGVGQSTAFGFNSGQYVLAYVQGGANYQVTTCGGSTGGGPIYDTQLTVYNDATGAFIAYNDDNCGLQSTVNFTSSFCGYVRILLHQYSCNGSNLPWRVTMTQNTPGTLQTYTLSAVPSQTNVSCFGLTNGQAMINVPGTTGAVRYSWAPSGGVNALATGLSPGVYTVTTTDAGCKGNIQTYTITEPPPLSTVSSYTDVSCSGGSNGLGSITVSGGTAPYTYSWSPSGGSGATSSGLPIGTYTNNISDANGCATSATVTISEPLPLAITAASGSISCLGGSNGTASVSVSGGIAPYNYDWMPGTPSGDGTASVSGLTAGTYTCSVTDSKSCAISKTITITEPATAVSSATAATDVLCFGNSTGSATVTASGGTGAYTYLWSTAATTSVITGQPAGVKTVTVTDANSCKTINSVTISQPATAVSSATAVTNVLCFGNSTGSATVTASGGTGAYTYLWSTAATTSVITGQPLGVKTVTVTDANNCKTTNSVTITQPSALILNATASNSIVCSTSSSTLTATGSGGAGAYTYTWVAGPATNTFVVNPVTATIYTVNSTDANSCAKSTTVSISVNALPTIAVNSGTLCSGNAFTMIPTGAATYIFSSGSAVVSPTTTTSYSVTGTSALGCVSSNTAVSSVTVSICSPAAALDFDGSNDRVSIGSAINSILDPLNKITVEAWVKPSTTTGLGVIAGNYHNAANQMQFLLRRDLDQYAFWVDDGTGFKVANSLPASVVIGTWQHVAGVWDGSKLMIYVNGVLHSTTTGVTGSSFASTANPVIMGFNSLNENFTGSIDEVRIWTNARTMCEINTYKSCEIPTTATGLLANYHFNQGFDSNPNPSVTTLTDASGNSYTGTLSSFALNGPTSNWIAPGGVVSGSVTPLTLPTSTLTSSNVLCNGGTGTASVVASGGTPAYTYFWSNAATTSTISAVAGVYTNTVTDANGCITTTSVTIIQPSALVLNATASNSIVCSTSSSTLTATGSGGTGTITYTWVSGPTTNTFVVNPTSTTIYTVNSTDANSCAKSTTVTVSVNALPVIAVNSGTLCSGNSFTMIPTGAATYTFSSGSAVVSPTITTSYSVTGTSALGCVSSNTAVSNVNVSVCSPAAALNFDGIDDAVSLGAFAVNGAAPRTVEFWIKTLNTGSFQNPFSSGTANNNQTFNVKVTPTGQLGFMGFNNDNYPSTGTIIADNTYHHIALAYDGANVKAYIDGAYEWTFATTLATTGTNNFIGKSNHLGNEQYFQGTIDELRVWNVARTQCELNTYKNCEIPTTATGLIANYHFNQGFDSNPNPSVTTLTDASGNSYTGTLSSFALNGPTSNWIAPGGVVSGSVTPLTLPTSTLTSSNVLCNGGTGTATVVASSGTPAYTYLWSNAATTFTISAIAGVYTNTVTDVNTCSVTKTVTITQPTAIATSTAATNILCNGGSTGSATITASGGTGAYTYLWSTTATTSVITGETAGVKTVTVTDANGCTKTNTVTINQPATAVSSATAVTNVLCFGNSTGSATVTASGGTGAYTYLWSTAATTSVITGQPLGVRTVTVTDANGCTTTNTVTITEPATAVSSATAVTNVLCFGNSTGSATVTASGGTGAYTYVWSNAATTSVITGLTAGVKTVTVTDANGCTTTNTVTITQPAAALTATQTQTNATCVIPAMAAVSASGGTLPYTYLWSPSGGNASTSTTVTAGNYTCTVTDANNCSLANPFAITANTVAPVVAVSGNTVICDGASSVLTASGANTYTWSTGATTTTISVNPSSTTNYSVTGTNTVNGCTQLMTYMLTVNPNPTVTATPSSTVICSSQSATLTAGGATSYTWSTGSNTSSIVVTPSITTTYTLNGDFATGCSNTTSVSITVVNTPTVTVASSNSVICSGATSTLTASGAITYSWSTGATGNTITVNPATSATYTVNGMVLAGCNSNGTTSITVNPLPTLTITASQSSVCAGNTSTLTAGGATTYTWSTAAISPTISVSPSTVSIYTVTATDVNGCVNTKTQTISIYPTPLMNVSSSTASVCTGFSSTLTASGVSTYTWSTGSNSAVVSVSPVTNTTYTVNGTDVNGCTTNTNIAIGISATPTLVTVPGATAVCEGSSVDLSVSGAVSYLWSTGSTNSSITVSPPASTMYSVTGTNGAGCNASTTVSVTIYIKPTVSLGADIEIGSGTVYQFNPAQTGAVSYTWSPATYLSATNILNPTTTPDDDITYILMVSSVNGCVAGDTIFVKTLKDLVIANYMSPNDDGQNDTWKVSVPSLIKDYSIAIIDSYGKTVYSKTDNYSNDFDGKLGGQDLPDGVYYYFIKDGNTTKYKGSITLTK
ncbi:MAG: LamG-like jellyroll fold domain-containing protein [Bacteroidota bacterium]